MRERELKGYLREALSRSFPSDKAGETVKLCTTVMLNHYSRQEEERTGFLSYLSDIFRFEGIVILGLQAAALLIACLGISNITDTPESIPAFVPLFVLAATPILFRSQACGMCEIEAVTRASGAQIVLAKLILAGAANLFCMTVLSLFEMHLRGSYDSIAQIVLYALVPYLVCMVFLLRQFRLGRREGAALCIVVTLSSCVGWGLTAIRLPWLYETSAMGIWIITFVVFTVFFIKEIYYIVKTRKEGKMYGVVA